MANKVNLDALIPREDFEIRDTKTQSLGRNKDTLSINDLRIGDFFFSSIRKPDFQRETNEWDISKISKFINSFLDGDLIPAIILWRSNSSNIFVIDGSHRISALAAWVNDDYGDGDISKQFYNGIIPDEQIEIAERTRRHIRKEIGPFKDYLLTTTQPEKVKPEIRERAKSLGALAIQLQWVQGDASKAEDSFFNINQQASPINATELRLLKARSQPNAIAARAIVRSGTGHKYWSSFPDEKHEEIENLGREINELLFEPKLDTPIKTLDVPIGGKLYSSQTLSLILDFVNIVNNVSLRNEEIEDDSDGSGTINFLSKSRKVVQRINSNHPGSLGLHPVVYFYSANGKYKIGSFFAITALVIEFEKKNLYKKFTKVRADFEEFIIQNDYLVQQILRRYRSTAAGFEPVRDFYMLCIEKLNAGVQRENLVNDLLLDNNYKYLTQNKDDGDFFEVGADFSNETKSEIYIREAIAKALKCQICGGYVHKSSMSFDHIVRKSEGGMGTLENAQITHPYCNTTLKN